MTDVTVGKCFTPAQVCECIKPSGGNSIIQRLNSIEVRLTKTIHVGMFIASAVLALMWKSLFCFRRNVMLDLAYAIWKNGHALCQIQLPEGQL